MEAICTNSHQQLGWLHYAMVVCNHTPITEVMFFSLHAGMQLVVANQQPLDDNKLIPRGNNAEIANNSRISNRFCQTTVHEYRADIVLARCSRLETRDMFLSSHETARATRRRFLTRALPSRSVWYEPWESVCFSVVVHTQSYHNKCSVVSDWLVFL